MDDSIYQAMRKKGITRRQFLKMCSILAATMGLEPTAASDIARGLENKRRLPVIYLDAQECTCCAESLLRTSHPLFTDLILNLISLDYMEPIMAVSGRTAEQVRNHTIREFAGHYLVLVEGAIPLGANGAYTTVAGTSILDVLKVTAKDAVAVIAYGSCATNTCASGAHPNPTGAVPVKEIITDKPVIDVPGCPPIAEVISGVIAYYLAYDRLPELTNLGRPAAFYNKRIHDTCSRRAFFDAGMFVESFDDTGAHEGWCLYKMGCKGPTTFNACGIVEWNDSISWPVKSGNPCIGCSEPGYFDNGPLTKLAHIPGVPLPKDPDAIGKGVAAVTAAGVGIHAVATGLIKRDKLKHENNDEEERD